ncbi:MAG: dephospho-CoA kinase [Caulobacteraceae bacterium]|jgi:dephospho-CoA kinase|nr:dephospho-CoA kinase [Caulobacteraceae bacterium]
MIVLGLTGSIGMGKSTTAELFRQAGAPVHDADAAVAGFYAAGGAGVAPVARAFPMALVDGAIDRERLSALVLGNPDSLKRLEAIVHPLVRQDRARFLAEARASGARVAVLEVQLLFEVGAENEMDAVIVVSAPPDVQRERTLLRPGMTAEKYERILARQLPDAEKRARADFVIDTGHGVDAARDAVSRVLETVLAPGWQGRRQTQGEA